MNRKKKSILIILTIFILVIALCLSLFYISKSRNFQFFGEIVCSLSNEDKIIALTFDDGPTENTAAILDKLDELNVVATFFVCGNNIEERPEDAKAIVEAGHVLGNHSFSHQRMLLKFYDFYKDEIDKTNELIRESGYEQEIFFRPPYCKKLFGLPYYLNSIGMVTVTWDMEPETVLGFNAKPEEIAQYVIDNVESSSIILLHPMYNKDNVLLALDILVPELRSQGYTFSTIPDMYKE